MTRIIDPVNRENLLLSSDYVPLIEKRICHPRLVGGH